MGVGSTRLTFGVAPKKCGTHTRMWAHHRLIYSFIQIHLSIHFIYIYTLSLLSSSLLYIHQIFFLNHKRENDIQSWAFTPKNVSVYFLRIRMFSYITTVVTNFSEFDVDIPLPQSIYKTVTFCPQVP